MVRKVGAVLLSVLMSACVTSRTWEMPSEDVLQHKVKPGDQVVIVAPNRSTYSFEVTSVAEDALHGRQGGKRYKVMFSMIDSIHVRRPHPVATAFTMLGVVAVICLATAKTSSDDKNFDPCQI